MQASAGGGSVAKDAQTRRPRRRLGRALLPLAAAFLLVAVTFLPGVAPTTFDPYGDDPGSFNAWRSLAESEGYTVAPSLTGAAGIVGRAPERTLLVVVTTVDGPIAGPRLAEAVSEFAARDGRVLLFDAAGRGVPIAVALGLPTTPLAVFEARLDGRDGSQVDAVLEAGGGRFDVRLHGVTSMATLAPDARAVAATGNRSFADLDGDRRLDDGDTRGPFVVAAASPEAHVVVVAAAPFMDDAGLVDPGHEGAAMALLRGLLPEGGEVVIDLSLVPRDAPGAWVAAATRAVAPYTTESVVRVLVPLLALAAAFVSWRRTAVQGGASTERAPSELVAGTPAGFDAARMGRLLEHGTPASRAGGPLDAHRAKVRAALAALTPRRGGS